jgi:hypothetical protein
LSVKSNSRKIKVVTRCSAEVYEPTIVATLSNVLLVLLPNVCTLAIITAAIKATMTAYSTAVAPSSETKNLSILLTKLFIATLQIGRLPAYSSTAANRRANR